MSQALQRIKGTDGNWMADVVSEFGFQVQLYTPRASPQSRPTFQYGRLRSQKPSERQLNPKVGTLLLVADP